MMLAFSLMLQLLPALPGTPLPPAPPPRLAPMADSSVRVAIPPLIGRTWVDWTAVREQADAERTDTARTRRRTRAIEYGSLYHTRLILHRWLSFAMLPLFAGSYVTGDQVLRKGNEAPSWARRLHGPFAAGTAVLFGANTITGAWNLWEGRKDPAGRAKRYVHSILFTAAGAGFLYAASKTGDDDGRGSRNLKPHRNIALVSMGLSVSSWALMLFFK